MNAEAPIQPSRVRVEDPRPGDAQAILDYWYRSPPAFLEGMGVDLDRLPAPEQLEARIEAKIRGAEGGTPPSDLLMIRCDASTIGFHIINEMVPGDGAIFHGHIFDPAFRRRGVAMTSYPLACRVFLDRFDLRRMWFKTPAQNLGAIRVKEKLGIRRVGEERVDFGVIRAGTRAVCFEWTREELAQFEARGVGALDGS